MNKSLSPEVVVLLAAHNGIRWLEEQVGTILDQKDASVRLVVSVDASTDGTESWFDELHKRDHRVELLPHGRLFGRASANFYRLILEADLGDCAYVAFADQDDIWFEDKLRRAMTAMTAGKFDVYSGNVLAFWPDGRERLVMKAQPQRKWDYLFEAAGPGCTYVLSRPAFDAFRDFIEANQSQLEDIYLHDWLCYAFARSRGFNWVIDPEPKMFYRQHAQNHMGVHSGPKAIAERAKNIINGWWVNQARSIALILGLQDEPFVKPWVRGGRSGYLFLIRNVRNFRRKPADALFMAAAMAALLAANP